MSSKNEETKVTRPYKREIDGIYGQFRTTDSIEVNYLLTNFTVDEIDNLELASDALNFKEISFEDLIQRDIDIERVDKELVDEYLHKGKDKVIFFPPLLVSLMAIRDEKHLEEYPAPKINITPYDEDDGKALYTCTWGENMYQLELPLRKEDTQNYLIYGEKKHYFIKYLSTLKFNTPMKLVVIDGQHRFKALKRVLEKKERYLLDNLQFPVCIFFSSTQSSATTSYSYLRKMRELFVTINTEAKKVSGHFVALLNDRKLSSLCVRDFADNWKQNMSYGFSYLHLLEWNQRQEGKAHQITRKYSISTVSIIAQCLEDYIFNNRDGYTATILMLSPVKPKIELSSDSIKFDQISEDFFDVDQIPVLKQQIKDYVTPSLCKLFTLPRPYKEVLKQFEVAIDYLKQQIKNNVPGAEQYYNDVLLQFRRTYKHDLPKVKDIETEFENLFINIGWNSTIYEDQFFFSNLFQQAVIRSWAMLCNGLTIQHSIAPTVVAEALVAAFDKSVFNPKKGLLLPDKKYNQYILYSKEKILVNDRSRDQVTNLLISSLKIKGSLKAFMDTIKEPDSSNEEKNKGITNSVIVLIDTALQECVSSYKEVMYKHWKKNWRFEGLDESVINFLSARDKTADEKMKKEFEDKISELSQLQMEAGLEVLANVLEIKTEDLLSIV